MSYDRLLKLLDDAVDYQPGLAIYAGPPAVSPPWYGEELFIRNDVTKSYPAMVWLQKRVGPAMEEALRRPQVRKVILGALPTPAEPPPPRECDEDGNYLNDDVQREWEARFHVPAVRVWVLWAKWGNLVGNPKLPPAPDYPGLERSSTYRRKFLIAIKVNGNPDTQLSRELAGHTFLLPGFGCSLCLENSPVVDSICAALNWLRQELEAWAELAKQSGQDEGHAKKAAGAASPARGAKTNQAAVKLDEKRNRIRVRDSWYDLSEDQTHMLSTLLVAEGAWVGGKNIGNRPDRLRKKMPVAVQKVVATHKRHGYRLTALLPK